MNFRPLLFLSLAPLAAASVSAIEITLPGETVRLSESPLPGYTLATALCYTCHSADYVRYQPSTSPRAYWKATVVKMQKVFGAPIPDEAVEPLTDYLVKTYGAERAAAASATTKPAASPSAAKPAAAKRPAK